jgi:hypothetical protein
MYNDGLIGNFAILETLGNLTAGVYNYMRESKAKAYSLKDIIPTVHEYMYPPKTEQEIKEEANEQLLRYVLLKPNTPKKLMEKKHG